MWPGHRALGAHDMAWTWPGPKILMAWTRFSWPGRISHLFAHGLDVFLTWPGQVHRCEIQLNHNHTGFIDHQLQTREIRLISHPD